MAIVPGPAVCSKKRKNLFILSYNLPGEMAIGVAISTSPYGPFKMPLNKPLIFVQIRAITTQLYLLMMTGKPICIGEEWSLLLCEVE